jgi:predicted metalloprotease with PDZ domain
MTRLRLILVLVLAAAPTGVTEAGQIQWKARTASETYLLPNPLPDFGLGIDGRFVREGIAIVKAERNRAAFQVGLEPGDVIVSVNGQALREPRDWIAAMTDQGGRFHLRIRDIRTGNMVDRDVDLRQ